MDRQKNRYRYFLIGIYLLYLLLCMIPIMRLGISCGDDMYWQSARRLGICELAKKLWNEVSYQGRPLAIVQVISLVFSFFDNMFLFKISKIFFIILDCILVSSLIRRFDRMAAILNMILFPLSIQIAFQNSPPECYSIFILLPFAIFLVSCILFDEWLIRGEKYLIITSLGCLFFSLCSYEVFILYCPLYAIIAFYRTDGKILGAHLKNILFSIRWHILVGLLYLGIYGICRMHLGTNYDGVKVGISSIKGMLEIWRMLVLSGIPGMYQKDLTVSYLFETSTKQYTSSATIWIENILSYRLIILICLCCILLITTFKKGTESTNMKKELFLVVILSYFVCVPPILNAISVSWQRYSGSKQTIIGSTVSYLIMVAFICIISILLSLIARKKNAFLWGVCICIIIALGGRIQIYNEVLSELQAQCSKRFENIEEILKSDILIK